MRGRDAAGFSCVSCKMNARMSGQSLNDIRKARKKSMRRYRSIVYSVYNSVR